MSKIEKGYTVCDQCNGAIPGGADHITEVQGTLVLSGQQTSFGVMDFCCSAHMSDWVNAHPSVATPNPLYPPPPAGV
jgi:hypothetical protein